MLSFLDLLPAAERQQIQKKATDLATQLTAWASNYPSIRPSRIGPVALLLSVVAPGLNSSSFWLAAKSICWIFLLDDRVDERVIDLTDLPDRIEGWRRIALNGARGGVRRPAGEDDELDRLLSEIRSDLAGFSPSFEQLRERWAREMCRLVDGMAQEGSYGLQYSLAESHLPSLEEYLYTGMCSGGLPWWAVTVLITAHEPTVLDDPEIIKAIEHAGIAIRLYNDYQTSEKERGEGKINSVVIAYHALLRQRGTRADSVLLAQAHQQVWELGDCHAQTCRILMDRSQTASGLVEDIVLRTVAFHASLYRQHDYHTTVIEEVLA